MMKQILLIIGFVCSYHFCFSQEDVVSKIRKSYNEYNKAILQAESEQMSWLPPKMVVSFDKMERAIGLVSYSRVFYYDIVDEFVENGEATEYVYKSSLRKLIINSKSVSYQNYAEYFYDENEKLIFFYSKSHMEMNLEERFYFNNKQAVKIQVSSINTSNSVEKAINYTHYSKDFTEPDKEKILKIMHDAESYKLTFHNLQN